MPPDDPATPGDDVSELDELERLAKAAGSLYWNAAVRPKGKRPRAFLFAYRRPNDVTADGFSGQVACFWDERNVDAVANVAFAEAANPAAVLALINHLRALTADRDAHRAAAQEAEAAHDKADNALCAIHRALWPGHRTDWVYGEATGMGAAIVAGVAAAVGERDSLRRAVEKWVTKRGHDRCWYYPDLFREIAVILKIDAVPPGLPPREEFEEGCRRYQCEEYAPAPPPGDAGTPQAPPP